MGFFATFWSWLNGQLAAYIGDNTARLAEVLEPAVVTLATLYVMAWGYLQLTGTIEEPLVAGLKRIAMLALVLGVGPASVAVQLAHRGYVLQRAGAARGGVIGATDPVAPSTRSGSRAGPWPETCGTRAAY